MSPYYRGHLAMLLFSALVAGSFSLGSMVANDIAPMALNAIRFVIAGVVIGVAAHLTHGLRPAHFRAPWRFAVLGGLFAVYFVLMFYGLQTAPPVSAAAVFTLTPVLSAVFGFLLLRQITTLPMALALAIGGAGAIWVIFRGDLSAMRAFEVGQGEITYFWGCVAHAIYTPMVRRLNRGEPAVVFTFGTLVAGAIILTLFGWQDIRATDWASLSSLVWITILYVAVFASAATFVLLQYASLHLPSAKVMAYTYLTPSWVILWEIALGKGVPDVIVLLGIALSVLALVMLLEGRARTSKA
ncbi:carboxylate/amino acid/amine transporter [Phaeobacter italicus]|jgi:drug/metabolite transporter (DMT)-like permease|uniref:Carboxylate/amino acid/amine transporter n=1 Tax=Phaeobacter italicus TaxID=481446 RepID=A0A0H5D5F1_9RHOB|nr:DMT family transporter [Phaeobacter italicus]CRL12326.1 carboxylate/amino acid/amine transporter [Phaeobacter italicus]